MTSVARFAAQQKLKEQAREVLILINAYLRHPRNRSTSVHETDDEDSELIEELNDQIGL